jgi:predicted anti-sigma-YlaC factor YlaD
MLNCREVSERVSDFIDATLPLSARLQMRLHLLMCSICREYVRQVGLVVGALRRLPPQEPTAELRTELLAMFRAERS